MTEVSVEISLLVGELPRIECESKSHTEGWISLGVHDEGGAKFYAQMLHECVDFPKGHIYVVCASLAKYMRRADELLQCGACDQEMLREDWAVVIGEIGK